MGSDLSYIYRGVFRSPLDYEMASYDRELAKLRKANGEEISDNQKESCDRLDRLEELGGVIKPLTSKNLSEEISKEILNIFSQKP